MVDLTRERETPATDRDAPPTYELWGTRNYEEQDSLREGTQGTPIFENVPNKNGESNPKALPLAKRYMRDWTPGSEAPPGPVIFP